MVKQEQKDRSELKEKYNRDAKLIKYKQRLVARNQSRTISQVIQETGKYSIRFLFLRTDDEILYKYKRKLQKEIQWKMATMQLTPILMGYLLFALTRRLKQKQSTDVIYFMAAYSLVNYGVFLSEQHKLFELSYPAHPVILEKRAEVINALSFHYPQILKNEIEFLYEQVNKEEETKKRYEKEFSTGKGENKKRFSVIVEDGKVMLKCIDSFEDIFQLSREVVEELELTDILDPYIFDSHKDIINALFEVYYDLGNQYIQKYYFATKEMEEMAKKKVRRKYGLDESGISDAREIISSLKK